MDLMDEISTIRTPSIVHNGDTYFGTIRHTLQLTTTILTVRNSILKSPLFAVGNNSEYDAQIVFYPNWTAHCVFTSDSLVANSKALQCCYYVEFTSKTADTSTIIGKVSATILDKTSNTNFNMLYDCPIEHTNNYCSAGGCQLPYGHCEPGVMLTRHLTITCQITLNAQMTLAGLEKPLPSVVLADHTLKDDITALIKTPDLVDLTLIAEGEDRKAHKLILAARSPVFAKMFQTEMPGKEVSVVKLDDMDYDVLQSLLVYMYTDEVPRLDDHAEALLSAADKYQLLGLKATCEEALASGMTTENAAGMFLLADLYRAESLKARAVAYINDHMENVRETGGWRKAKEEHPLALVMSFL